MKHSPATRPGSAIAETLRALSLLICAALTFGTSVLGADWTNNAIGNWSSTSLTTDWKSATVPNAPGVSVRYMHSGGAGLSGEVTLDMNTTVGLIQHENGVGASTGVFTVKSSGTFALTMDNTGGGTNLLGNSNAAIVGNGNANTFNITCVFPDIVIANTDLDIGSSAGGVLIGSTVNSNTIRAATDQNLNLRWNGGNPARPITINASIGTSGAGKISVNHVGTGSATVTTTVAGSLGSKVVAIKQDTDRAILNLSGNNSACTGTTSLVSGIILATHASALGTGGAITFSGGTLRYASASAAQDWGARIVSSTGPVAIDTNGQAVTLSAIGPTNTAGLAKKGSGTLTLAGGHSFSGATFVSGGTLAVDGSTHAAAPITVGGDTASGTPVLGGTGVVKGSVNVAAAGAGVAGTVNPGGVGAVGLLQTGTTVVSGTLAIEFNATLADKLVVNGNLDISAGTLALTPLATPALPSFTIATWTGSLTGSSSVQIAGVPSGYSVVFDGASKAIKLVAASGYVPLSATAAASSTLNNDPSNGSALATDGNFNTRWIAAADTSTTKSTLTLDLGAARTANRFSFVACKHGRTYKLESSSNGTTWTTINASFTSGVGTDINSLRKLTTLYFQPVTARYFRLTSTSSIVGESMSVWEAQVINDGTAAPVLSRLASSKLAVQAYTDSSEAGQIKRAVLDISIEQADAELVATDLATVTLLLDDVDTVLAANAETMAAPTTSGTNFSALFPLRQPSMAQNPYLRRIRDGVTLAFGTADTAWPRCTEDLDPLGDLNVGRDNASKAESWLWVFAHPNSPNRHSAEALRRLLRRAHAAVDSINVHGSYGSGVMDVFACGTMSVVLREFQALYPGLIPPNQNAYWNSACQIAGGIVRASNQNNTGGYPNINVGDAVSLYNFGTQLGDADMVAKSQTLIRAVLDRNQVYPDGGVSYIWTQNEAGGYQGTVATYVNLYYLATGCAPALEILQKMEWYGPINGKTFDWWTSPSWKHMWNSNSGSGQTCEATNGKNPYTRAILDTSINAAATSTNWIGAPDAVSWYEQGTAALSWPDYTVFDRNIVGPRAWYGQWNYTATLRAINDSEPGHSTIMGCQVLDSSTSSIINAAVMGVFSRIRTSAAGSRDADGTFAEYNHAWLTSKLVGDSTVGDGFSAIGVSHKIHIFASSSKGTERDWTVRQIWLNLSDRVIGLQQISPNTTQTAYEVQGAIRLGFGGTAYSSTKTLVSNGTNSWTYGNLAVKIHGHNYAEVAPEVYEFRRAQAPITEITLRDQVGGAANTTANTYEPGPAWKYICEIRPTSTTTDVSVTELAPPGGLTGFEIFNPNTGRRYRVIFNPGNAAVDYTPAIAWSGHAYLYRSGTTKFRPDWVPDPTGPLPGVEITSPSTIVSIPANAHVVITPVSPVSVTEQWRYTHFGIIANSGSAADSADPDHDGEANLMEFATGQNPNAAMQKPGAVLKSGTNLEFTYTRSDDALAAGFIFAVEYSDTLAAGSWLSVGAGSIQNDDGTLQTMKATVPAGSGARRFIRLKITKP